jgi:flagellar FliJ protein
MKKFSFELQTLLEIRARKEDEIKLQLAEKNRLITYCNTELLRINEELKHLQVSEKQKRKTQNSVMALRYSVAYRHKLKQDLLKTGRKIDDLNADVYKIQVLLVNATKERKAIELIKEKRFQEWKKEYGSEQQKITDDISQQGYIRKRLVRNDSSV